MSHVNDEQKRLMLDLLRTAGLVAASGGEVSVTVGGDSVTFEA